MCIYGMTHVRLYIYKYIYIYIDSAGIEQTRELAPLAIKNYL